MYVFVCFIHEERSNSQQRQKHQLPIHIPYFFFQSLRFNVFVDESSVSFSYESNQIRGGWGGGSQFGLVSFRRGDRCRFVNLFIFYVFIFWRLGLWLCIGNSGNGSLHQICDLVHGNRSRC